MFLSCTVCFLLVVGFLFVCFLRGRGDRANTVLIRQVYQCEIQTAFRYLGFGEGEDMHKSLVATQWSTVSLSD